MQYKITAIITETTDGPIEPIDIIIGIVEADTRAAAFRAGVTRAFRYLQKNEICIEPEVMTLDVTEVPPEVIAQKTLFATAIYIDTYQ